MYGRSIKRCWSATSDTLYRRRCTTLNDAIRIRTNAARTSQTRQRPMGVNALNAYDLPARFGTAVSWVGGGRLRRGGRGRINSEEIRLRPELKARRTAVKNLSPRSPSAPGK